MPVRTAIVGVLLVAVGAAGCGSASHRPRSTAPVTSTSTTTATTTARHTRSLPARPAAIVLRPVRSLGSLPAARSGIAVASFGSSIVVAGGLSPAGTSTSTVFRIDANGTAHSTAPLPGPVHDAASTELAGRLLVFGGGQFEGSDRIIELLPGVPRQIGTLPQSLSDLTCVTIGRLAYVVGGWNGTTTNRDVYTVSPGGTVGRAGTLALGVRYPAVAALAGRVIVAGGETTTGRPTRTAWSFDPTTRRVTRIPDLPAAIDHGAGAAFAGRFYLLGGLRNGSFTSAIISWAPGETRWRAAGRLPTALADMGATPSHDGIVIVGGRDSAGKVAAVTVLAPG